MGSQAPPICRCGLRLWLVAILVNNGFDVKRYSNNQLSDDFSQEMEPGAVWSTLAGQPTDDSEMALVLARSIVLDGRYDPESAAAPYRYLFASGPFDFGRTTSAALGAISEDQVRARMAAAAARRSGNARSESNC